MILEVHALPEFAHRSRAVPRGFPWQVGFILDEVRGGTRLFCNYGTLHVFTCIEKHLRQAQAPIVYLAQVSEGVSVGLKAEFGIEVEANEVRGREEEE